MKKIVFLFNIAALAWIAFSCKDDYSRSPEGAITPTAPVFASPGQSNVRIQTLAGEAIDTFLIRLNWSKARFTYENGLPAEVPDLKYTIDVDTAGDFSSKLKVTTTDVLYTDLYSSQVNDWIQNLYGTEHPQSVSLIFRVSTTDSNGNHVYSNIISLNVQYVSTDVPPPPPPANDIMIKWKQVTGGWTDFAIYAWGDAEVFGGWPGKHIIPDESGWYSTVIPKNRPIHLILNNNGGGSQFDFLNDPAESGSYEVNTDAGTFTKVDNPAEPVTIRWKYIGTNWTAFAIYAWGGSPNGETFGGWPGTTVTPDANGWCSVTVPAGQTVGNVIFNNTQGGAGNQFDVTLNIISSVCFEITDDSYTIVNCQ